MMKTAPALLLTTAVLLLQVGAAACFASSSLPMQRGFRRELQTPLRMGAVPIVVPAATVETPCKPLMQLESPFAVSLPSANADLRGISYRDYCTLTGRKASVAEWRQVRNQSPSRAQSPAEEQRIMIGVFVF